MQNNKTVTCLGKIFSGDEARRKYFTAILKEKLPKLKQMEGFPHGTDEDILALSDPPYYTACPNPFINDFIIEWEKEKRERRKGKGKREKLESWKEGGRTGDQRPADENYSRDPFVADVSEGKNHPIYNAHSYHTKVPHKAIMRYILHYTNPGDIIFDGFCGTGMTGVAARMCGDKNAVMELGYRVDAEGNVWRRIDVGEQDFENGPPNPLKGDTKSKKWEVFSKLGERKAVLNDLSPAATFIAYNYNTPVDVYEFEREASRILAEVEKECGWMYEVGSQSSVVGRQGQEHRLPTVAGKLIKGKINYTVWSDVFICPSCGEEIVFWEVAVDKEAGKVKDVFNCQACAAQLKKRDLTRAWITFYDEAIQETVRQAKQVPVLINYTAEVMGKKKRLEKKPDRQDLELIRKINEMPVPYWFPTDRMPEGYNTEQPKRSHGITHVHHFYTKRNGKNLPWL